MLVHLLFLSKGHLKKLVPSSVAWLNEIFIIIWSCPFVDWLYLGSEGASDDIVLMWDRRVVEKLEEAVGNFSISLGSKMSVIILSGPSLVSMVQI